MYLFRFAYQPFKVTLYKQKKKKKKKNPMWMISNVSYLLNEHFIHIFNKLLHMCLLSDRFSKEDFFDGQRGH